MDSQTFLRRVHEAGGEAEHYDKIRHRHTIGRVSLNGVDVRIAVSLLEGRPLDGEGFATIWVVTTASTESDDTRFYQKATIGELVPGPEIARIPAGRNPWLPDDAMVGVARQGELPPAVFLRPNEDRLMQRFPIEVEVSAGGQADL